MRIGYDAKRAFLNATGLGNYSRWLIRSVASFYPENTYYLYTPKLKPGKQSFTTGFKNLVTIVPIGKLFTSWWRSKGIVEDLLRDQINIYHGLSHELPLGIRESGIRSVVTVHDLIFMRFPQHFGWINRRIYALKVHKACTVADKIIAISQKTKSDIMELLHIDPNKIEVIYQGCDPAFSVVQSDEQKKVIAAKYHLPENYLLTVGTIEERKNLILLAKALKHIDSIPLVVVGKPTDYLKEVKQYLAANNSASRVIFLHQVEFADLPAIYQLASVFIYPSRYEGFGIPVLEALNSGVPVVAATGSCLEEAGGPDSLYADPDDETGLAANVNRILGDKQLAQHMITQGLHYTANFNEQKLSAQLMKVYKTLNHA
jgi:glycosyltransferase involved in cell wall biosynthesis